MGHSSSFGALPAETLTDILEYLSLHNLWTAARVSRRFYAAAWRSGLFIHREIRWTLTRDLAAALEVLRDVLEHAKRKDLRLSLTVWCQLYEEYYPDMRDKANNSLQDVANQLFPLISAALPFLVYLAIRIPDHLRPQLDSALHYPAPRLRRFEVFRTRYDHPCPTALPRGLFGRHAPQLRTVYLRTVPLPDKPIPAFSAVSRAIILYHRLFPHIGIGLHFPCLNSLHLTLLAHHDGEAVQPDRFDISALALRSLAIEDCSLCGATTLHDVVDRCVDLSTISAVEVAGHSIRWDRRLWKNDSAGISMRISVSADGTGSLCITVVPEHRRWRRLYRLRYWDPNTPLPVGELPDLINRISYLRIDSTLLCAIQALRIAFPVLRDLHIDMPPNYIRHLGLAPEDYILYADVLAFDPAAPGAPVVWMPCLALKEITLFALAEPVTGADSRRVAFLVHALGQLQRPGAERAVLALVGVKFARPVARGLLGQTVSAIRSYAFAGIDSPEDYDEGLW